MLSAWKRQQEKFTLPHWNLFHCWLTRLSGNTPASSAWAAGAGDGHGWSPSDPWFCCDRGTTWSTSSGWSLSRFRTPGRASRLRGQRHTSRGGAKAEEATPHVTGGASSPTNLQAVDPDQWSTPAWSLCHSYFSKWKSRDFIKIKAVSWSRFS